MISLQQCRAIAGLSSREVILGMTPSTRHERLLRSYVAITRLSRAALQAMIVSDLRDFLALGAMRQAGDRFVVLRRFLSDERPFAASVESKDSIRVDGIRGWRRKSGSVVCRWPSGTHAAA
jgi:hypothetical protein